MKTFCYIQITAAFAAANNGYKAGPNVFRSAITNDGIYVVNANALNDFPELFADRSRLTPLFLKQSDFPTPETIL